MKRALVAIFVLGAIAGFANAQGLPQDLGSFVGLTLGGPDCRAAAANQVCIVNRTGSDQKLLGLNVMSRAGRLSGDGKPFGFALANSPNQITLANILPPDVVVPSGGALPVNIFYSGKDWPFGRLAPGHVDDVLADLAGSTIGNAAGTDLTVVAFPVIPEPNSGMLAAFALLGAFAFRRRR